MTFPSQSTSTVTGATHAPDGTGSVLFIGTATTLIRFGGFTILTDPNFLHAGEQVHLGYGLRSTRRTNPAMELEDLPPLDLVLLSHLHEDHFDRVVEQRLDHTLPILTTPHAAHALRGKGFTEARALHTWESWSFRRENIGTRLRITALPGQHTPLGLPMLPPVMGSLLQFETLEGAVLLRLYVSGDTLYHEALGEIRQRFPDIDLALLHLGGTRVLGLMLTMDGKQGLAALRLIAPRTAIPIHYDDYGVFTSPLEDFRREVEAAGLSDRVHYLARGEAYSIVGRGAQP